MAKKSAGSEGGDPEGGRVQKSRKRGDYPKRTRTRFHIKRVKNKGTRHIVGHKCKHCGKKYRPQLKDEGGNLVKHLTKCYPSWESDKGLASPATSWESDEGASTVPPQEILTTTRGEQPSSSKPERRVGSNDGAVVKREAVEPSSSQGRRVLFGLPNHPNIGVKQEPGCDEGHLPNEVKYEAEETNEIACDHQKSLTKGFEVPSRDYIDKMCDDNYKKATGDLFSEQRDLNTGRASLAVGTVRVMEVGQVLYTACNFIDSDWKLHRLVTGVHVAVPLAADYPGPSLLGLGQLKEVVSLDSKLHGAVLSDISRHRPNTLHGVFMPQGVKDPIKDLMKKKKKKKKKKQQQQQQQQQEEEEESNAKPQTTRELIYSTYVDDVLHSVAQCLVPEKSSPITRQMRTNMKTLERFTQNCHQALPYPGLDYPRSYDKQWYSLYCSLKILQGNDSTAPLLKVWGHIYHAIQKISKPSCPTSNLCLVELFNLREVLQKELKRAAKNNHHATDALTKARDTLHKAIEESYLVWSISLVLDPRYNLDALHPIFSKAYDNAEAQRRISDVESKISELCGDEDDGSGSRDTDNHIWKKPCTKRLILKDYLKKDPLFSSEKQKDPVEYEGKDFDILEWWKEQTKGQNCKDCKDWKLGRLARDFLAMPTCSLLSSEQISQVGSIIHQAAKEEAAVAAAAAAAAEEEEEEEEVVQRKGESSRRTKKKEEQQQKKKRNKTFN